MTKVGYSDSLKQLERISEEIHDRRRQQLQQAAIGAKDDKSSVKDAAILGTRQDGVGAEFPSPSLAEMKLPKERSDTLRKRSKHLKKGHKSQSNEVPKSNNTSDSDNEGKHNKHEDEVDANLLVDIDGRKSLNDHASIKRKKLKKKSHKGKATKYLPPSKNAKQYSAVKEDAINTTKNDIADGSSKALACHNAIRTTTPLNKQASISSSSTTESACNDATPPAMDNSIPSADSRSSSSLSSSASSVASASEESSTEQQSSSNKFYHQFGSDQLTNNLTPENGAHKFTASESMGKKINIDNKGRQ